MTDTPTPHRATPEQWALVEQYAEVDCYSDSVILELCHRLAAAEQRISELEGNSKPAPKDRQIRNSAPTGSLVERVRTAIVEHGDGETYTDEARAEIGRAHV